LRESSVTAARTLYIGAQARLQRVEWVRSVARGRARLRARPSTSRRPRSRRFEAVSRCGAPVTAGFVWREARVRL